MKIMYLNGKSETGKTITLKLLYCIFCENGAQNRVSVKFFRNSIEPAVVRKSIENLRYTKIGGRNECVANIAVKFKFKNKTFLIYTCGDSAEFVLNGIELAKNNDVDYYIAPTHPAFHALIRKEFSENEITFIEKQVSLKTEGIMDCNMRQAEELFQLCLSDF